MYHNAFHLHPISIKPEFLERKRARQGTERRPWLEVGGEVEMWRNKSVSDEGKTLRGEIKSRKCGEELATGHAFSWVEPQHHRFYNGLWPFKGSHT